MEETTIIQPEEPLPLKNHWVLWFHKVDDDDFTTDSFKKIYTLVDLEDFHATFNTLFNRSENMTVVAGMFFLMKEGIPPIWQDPKNINGAMWTYKVPKRDNDEYKADIVWKNLVAACCGECLTKDPEDMKMIHGISISPKLNNCIFKIWSNDTSKSDATKYITDEIEGIENDKTFFKKFKPDPKPKRNHFPRRKW